MLATAFKEVNKKSNLPTPPCSQLLIKSFFQHRYFARNTFLITDWETYQRQIRNFLINGVSESQKWMIEPKLLIPLHSNDFFMLISDKAESYVSWKVII